MWAYIFTFFWIKQYNTIEFSVTECRNSILTPAQGDQSHFNHNPQTQSYVWYYVEHCIFNRGSCCFLLGWRKSSFSGTLVPVLRPQWLGTRCDLLHASDVHETAIHVEYRDSVRIELTPVENNLRVPGTFFAFLRHFLFISVQSLVTGSFLHRRRRLQQCNGRRQTVDGRR